MGRIRRGYKQTEIGEIPEDWEVRRLGDIARFFSGGTPSTSISQYYGGDIRWINSSDLNRRIIWDVEGKITELGLKSSSAKMISENTLLIALYGATAGVVAISKIRASINQAVLAIIPDKEHIVFLFYMLGYLKDSIIDTYTQGGQPNLSGNIIKSIKIPLPPLDEQRRIAEALSDADATIMALAELIAKKRDIKHGTMQRQLTGQERLAGFSGEWEVVRLGDILKLKYGKSPSGILNESGIFPVIATSGEVGRTNQYIYNKPSIIIGRKGTIDYPQYIDEPFWAIDTAFYSEISEKAYSKFIFYLLSTINWYLYNEASGVPSLNAKTVESILLYIPLINEQIAIARVLSDMDADIEALQTEHDKWVMIKQGMMHELLTGKVRL